MNGFCKNDISNIFDKIFSYLVLRSSLNNLQFFKCVYVLFKFLFKLVNNFSEHEQMGMNDEKSGPCKLNYS